MKYVMLTEVRTDESKLIRKNYVKNGKDWLLEDVKS